MMNLYKPPTPRGHRGHRGQPYATRTYDTENRGQPVDTGGGWCGRSPPGGRKGVSRRPSAQRAPPEPPGPRSA